MNIFKDLSSNELADLKKALSHINNDEWDKAHDIAQSKEGKLGYDRIHALLHRMEGDKFNARYWYSRLNLQVPKISFEEEATQLIQEIDSL